MASRQEQPAEDADVVIVDDGGDLGHALFSDISIATVANETIHSSAVRVLAGKRYCTILRFMNSLTDHAQYLMEAWVASPKGPVRSSHLYSGDYSGVDGDFKSTI